MVAHALVDTLVVPAEDDDVLECREAVGLVLVVLYAVGRGVYNLVIRALALQLLDGAEYGFGLHHHARLPAEGVVVDGAAAVEGVVAQVVDDDLDETLLLRPLEDRLVQGRGDQLGYYGYDVYSHCSIGSL